MTFAAGHCARPWRPCLVGELNPHGADPRWALYPFPSWCAGDRLRRILGYTVAEYLGMFDRVNLLVAITKGQVWDAERARGAVELMSGGPSHRILLGARVAAAHGVRFRPFWVVRNGAAGWRALVLPHPSGRCRIWNDPTAQRRARAAVRRFLAEIEVPRV